MKLYTLHTPSHQVFYDNYFKPSLIPGEYELISEIKPQECATGSHYQEGWDKTTYRKVELFLQIAEENKGNHFVFSDVDIQFFGRTKETLLEELGIFDLAAQNDMDNMLCSGYFICNANNKTINMFNNMKKNFKDYYEDQRALNLNRDKVKWKYLSRKFFTIKHTFGKVWNGETDIEVPPNILLHHSNWTEGITNKIKLLDIVKSKMSQSFL